jgi:hypothetical protein
MLPSPWFRYSISLTLLDTSAYMANMYDQDQGRNAFRHRSHRRSWPCSNAAHEHGMLSRGVDEVMGAILCFSHLARSLSSSSPWSDTSSAHNSHGLPAAVRRIHPACGCDANSDPAPAHHDVDPLGKRVRSEAGLLIAKFPRPLRQASSVQYILLRRTTRRAQFSTPQP